MVNNDKLNQAAATLISATQEKDATLALLIQEILIDTEHESWRAVHTALRQTTVEACAALDRKELVAVIPQPLDDAADDALEDDCHDEVNQLANFILDNFGHVEAEEKNPSNPTEAAEIEKPPAVDYSNDNQKERSGLGRQIDGMIGHLKNTADATTINLASTTTISDREITNVADVEQLLVRSKELPTPELAKLYQVMEDCMIQHAPLWPTGTLIKRFFDIRNWYTANKERKEALGDRLPENAWKPENYPGVRTVATAPVLIKWCEVMEQNKEELAKQLTASAKKAKEADTPAVDNTKAKEEGIKNPKFQWPSEKKTEEENIPHHEEEKPIEKKGKLPMTSAAEENETWPTPVEVDDFLTVQDRLRSLINAGEELSAANIGLANWLSREIVIEHNNGITAAVLQKRHQQTTKEIRRLERKKATPVPEADNKDNIVTEKETPEPTPISQRLQVAVLSKQRKLQKLDAKNPLVDVLMVTKEGIQFLGTVFHTIEDVEERNILLDEALAEFQEKPAAEKESPAAKDGLVTPATVRRYNDLLVQLRAIDAGHDALRWNVPDPDVTPEAIALERCARLEQFIAAAKKKAADGEKKTPGKQPTVAEQNPLILWITGGAVAVAVLVIAGLILAAVANRSSGSIEGEVSNQKPLDQRMQDIRRQFAEEN